MTSHIPLSPKLIIGESSHGNSMLLKSLIQNLYFWKNLNNLIVSKMIDSITLVYHLMRKNFSTNRFDSHAD